LTHDDSFFLGTWSIFCHDLYHYDAGMTSLYKVDTCGDDSVPYYESSGKTRRYHIAAVDRQWDYSPETIHPLTGENYSDPTRLELVINYDVIP